MPTLILRNRKPELAERMDDPACDPTMLRNTYSQFTYVNRVISGWRRVYKRWLRPHLQGAAPKLLDIGCGGGDLVERLARWTARDGLDVEITALEPDGRAVEYLRTRALPTSVIVRQATISELVDEARKYDVVISNHVVHHLDSDELNRFLRDSTLLGMKLAVHNDIRRDDFAYLGFLPTALLFHRSFITVDGLTSIRRSYLPEELRSVVPESWRIVPMPLFRTLLVWKP